MLCSALLLLLARAEAFAAPVHGAGQSQQQGTQVQERIIVRARPLDSVAASVSIIDEETIDAANARTVAELLEYVAGARVLSSGSRGGATTIQLRGGDPNFVLVLLDGVPLNDPTDLEGGAVNLSSLPISSVQRIEVARGPLSYFYGSTALSGIINIVTRRGATRKPQLRATAQGGGNALFRADASVAGLAGGGDYYLGFDWEQQDGHIGDDEFRQANVQGRFTVPVGEAATLQLSTHVASWEADDYPESSGGPVFGSGDLRNTEATEFNFGADLRWSTSDGWRHRITGTYYRRDLERDSPGVFPLVPPSIEDTSYWHLRSGWLTTYDLPSVTLSAGVDIDHEDANNISTLLLPPFFGGDVRGDYALSRTTPGTFVEATASTGDLSIEAGLRADFPQDKDTEWNPRVGARYNFGQSGASVRGTVARGFKLPSFFALASPRQLGGNPDLRPETSVGVDFGVDQRVDDLDLTASFTVFWIRYKDLIDFDFDLFQNVNRDEVNAKGIEFSLRWNPDSRIAVYSDLTFQSAESPGSDQPLRNLPDWTGSVRVGYRPVEPLQIRLEISFAAESFDVQIAVPDTTTVDGYGVVDLAATWDVHLAWQLLARIDNLTDTSYEHFIGFPQPGITASVGLRYVLR
ncbi:MAG: TonB-dependent receptor [Acidobacteria bacterium]|nr:TonB-dependent receptor [Acidobacteriota bacterium]